MGRRVGRWIFSRRTSTTSGVAPTQMSVMYSSNSRSRARTASSPSPQTMIRPRSWPPTCCSVSGARPRPTTARKRSKHTISVPCWWPSRAITTRPPRRPSVPASLPGTLDSLSHLTGRAGLLAILRRFQRDLFRCDRQDGEAGCRARRRHRVEQPGPYPRSLLESFSPATRGWEAGATTADGATQTLVKSGILYSTRGSAAASATREKYASCSPPPAGNTPVAPRGPPCHHSQHRRRSPRRPAHDCAQSGCRPNWSTLSYRDLAS